jgi:hypothetical protein
MSDPHDPGPSVEREDERDRDDEQPDAEGSDEANREGTARDDQLERAIDAG